MPIAPSSTVPSTSALTPALSRSAPPPSSLYSSPSSVAKVQKPPSRSERPMVPLYFAIWLTSIILRAERGKQDAPEAEKHRLRGKPEPQALAHGGEKVFVQLLGQPLQPGQQRGASLPFHDRVRVGQHVRVDLLEHREVAPAGGVQRLGVEVDGLHRGFARPLG